MSSSSKILVLVSISLLGWLLLSSWNEQDESFTISGTIQALNGDVAGTKVYYTQDKKLTNLDRMDRFDVRPNGTFLAVVNGKRRAPVYFFVSKDKHLPPARAQKTLTKDQKVIEIGTINLPILPTKLEYGHLDGMPFPKLALYKDQCLSQLEWEVEIDKIRYFDNPQLFLSDCLTSDSGPVLKSRININGKSGSPIYFGLQQEDNTPEEGQTSLNKKASNVPVKTVPGATNSPAPVEISQQK